VIPPEIRPGAVLWAYVGGYWREVRVLEVKAGEHVRAGFAGTRQRQPQVRVVYRLGTGGRRARVQWVKLDRLRADRPQQKHHVVDMPAPERGPA